MCNKKLEHPYGYWEQTYLSARAYCHLSLSRYIGLLCLFQSDCTGRVDVGKMSRGGGDILNLLFIKNKKYEELVLEFKNCGYKMNLFEIEVSCLGITCSCSSRGQCASYMYRMTRAAGEGVFHHSKV